MNKILVLIITLFLTSFTLQTFAQNKDPMQKELSREYKRKLKEYKKGGWIVVGNRSIQVTLLKYFERLNEDDSLIPIEGTSSNCKSLNVCKQAALNNAQNEYTRLVSGKIVGAFGSIIKSNANRPQEEIDKMVGGLTNEVEADVAGVLEPQYSVYREKNGLKEYKTLFFINSKKLEGNIQNSLERSIKETKLTIEEAKSISKFVNDELKEDLKSNAE